MTDDLSVFYMANSSGQRSALDFSWCGAFLQQVPYAGRHAVEQNQGAAEKMPTLRVGTSPPDIPLHFPGKLYLSSEVSESHFKENSGVLYP